MRNLYRVKILTIGTIVLSFILSANAQDIPLPEHPRPDFMREQWLNLNGLWNFRFDKKDDGLKEKWFEQAPGFDRQIMVPFPWGSNLSRVENAADIGWYARRINVPAAWKGERVFVVVGASDWLTTIWLDGQELGTYQGGYTPFEFEISKYIKPGKSHMLVVRVDDTPHPFKLEGKQGYGDAKGIWQTIYLEARGTIFIRSLHFTPDIDHSRVNIRAILSEPATEGMTFHLDFLSGDQPADGISKKIGKGEKEINFDQPIENLHLWNLDDPFLYEVEASLTGKGNVDDKVKSYFGMRKISVVNLPGLNQPYIALNNKPLYLQLTLDQSYNPDGFYTFPSDEFMKEEILRSKKIGLNGNRIHIKIEVPRKLYWADKLGLLIMADVPNSWGEPDSLMQKEWRTAMEGLIERDYNHPAIFSWVLFNETWGLFSNLTRGGRAYLPATQEWVASMYRRAKQLDGSRLVEDNSACNYDHVATDIDSWHQYLPGYEWSSFLDTVVKNAHPGSSWNFVTGKSQGNQPVLNSECGNVWGYDGSTGDVDWSWDYHLMMNAFRSHPEVCGWLYTEHHDVINEWNGYYRFDRSQKYPGLNGIVPGMSLNDLHSKVYLAIPGPLCRPAGINETVEVPLFLSCMTGKDFGSRLVIRRELYGWDFLGRFRQWSSATSWVDYSPWMNRSIAPVNVQMPAVTGLAVLAFRVEDEAGNVLQRNFTTFRIGNAPLPRDESVNDNGTVLRIVRFSPASFDTAQWSDGQWNIFNGMKVNGAGSGYFEYRLPWPAGLDAAQVQEVSLVAELSAKQLFGKDRRQKDAMGGDYMRGKGTFDPSRNPNSYPMTDDTKYPTLVRIRVNGVPVKEVMLEDDPADHRGILSWYAQPHNHKLNEAGSYGYLVHAVIPMEALNASKGRALLIRFEVDKALPGGLAIYGEQFGRYPVDPSLVFVMKK